MTLILKFNCSLNIFCTWNIFNLNSLAFNTPFSLNRYVNIYSHLPKVNLSLTNTQSAEHFLHFSDDKFAVFRVSKLCLSNNFQQWHACPIVVNQALTVLNYCFRCVLFHLYTLDENFIFLVQVVVVKQSALLHDRVVLLCDLVTLG